MLKPGDPAPNFHLPDLDGQKRSLAQLIGDGPVLLAFFKISCPTCQFTVPFLDRAARSGRLRVFGISQDDAANTRAFQDRFDAHFPVLIDPRDSDYPASNAYRLTHVPSMFLVASDGRITWASNGFHRKDLESIGLEFSPEDRVPDWKPG